MVKKSDYLDSSSDDPLTRGWEESKYSRLIPRLRKIVISIAALAIASDIIAGCLVRCSWNNPEFWNPPDQNQPLNNKAATPQFKSPDPPPPLPQLNVDVKNLPPWGDYEAYLMKVGWNELKIKTGDQPLNLRSGPNTADSGNVITQLPADQQYTLSTIYVLVQQDDNQKVTMLGIKTDSNTRPALGLPDNFPDDEMVWLGVNLPDSPNQYTDIATILGSKKYAVYPSLDSSGEQTIVTPQVNILGWNPESIVPRQ